MNLSDPVDDDGECGCATCCLPTIVSERDEAIARAAMLEDVDKVREQAFAAAVAEKAKAHAALRNREEETYAVLRDLDEANAEREAAKKEAYRTADDNERLRISLSVAVGLLSEIQNWRHLRGTTMELPVQKFLAEMRAGLVPDQRDLKRALRNGEP